MPLESFDGIRFPLLLVLDFRIREPDGTLSRPLSVPAFGCDMFSCDRSAPRDGLRLLFLRKGQRAIFASTLQPGKRDCLFATYVYALASSYPIYTAGFAIDPRDMFWNYARLITVSRS